MTISDPTMDVVYKAMQGLAARQRATADNIANVETPGYKATKVDFESSLRQAITIGDPNQAQPAVTKSTEPNGPNENNVNIDDETVSEIDTNLKYQTMVEAMNAKFRLLRTAIGN
jgi:flagellar basal-body rod protein FlgB